MIFTEFQIVLLTINLNFILLSVFLFVNKNGNTRANKLFAIMLFVLAYVNTHFAFHYDKQVYLIYPNLIGTHTPVLFLIPPFLYFFYRVVFNSGIVWKRKYFIHVVPALLIFLLYLPLYFSSQSYKLDFIKSGECYFPFYLLGGLFFGQFVLYLFRILYEVSLHTKSPKINRSPILHYYKVAQIFTLSLLVTLFVIIFLRLNLIFIPLITSVFYYFICYHLLVHPEVFFSCQYANTFTRKYKSNELPAEVINDLFEVVDKYLKKEKAYLDSKISLPILAYRLNIPVHQLSQVINRKTNLNFNHFINRYRSDYCLTILADTSYRHFTMEAIGELSGFNSRQTLINSFKKFYNKTPSEYLKDPDKAFQENIGS